MTLPIAAVGTRGTEGYRFAEVATLLGPEQIGVTGDNSYATLYGRPYALVLDAETRRLRLFRGAVGGGSYEEVTTGLPAILFGVTYPEEARRFTAAFDQSARIIVAYELDGVVRVTRWTGEAYVQNVTFDGVDPTILMDATLTDPRGYPTAAADGWGVRDAYDAGIRILFEWLAGDPVVWLESAIPDSDVVLFYLTPDRLGVRARVQRQLYETVQELADLEEPVVLDRAIALSGRYQLLLSDELGDVRSEMLVSGAYVGDYIIAPAAADAVDAGVTPEAVRAIADTYLELDVDAVDAEIAPETVRAIGDTLPVFREDVVDAGVTPETIEAVGSVYPAQDEDGLDAGLATVDPIQAITSTELQEETDGLDATITPEVIRAQTV